MKNLFILFALTVSVNSFGQLAGKASIRGTTTATADFKVDTTSTPNGLTNRGRVLKVADSIKAIIQATTITINGVEQSLASSRSWTVGAPASVSSFNGRQNAVVPQAGDYTWAMIGSKPTTMAGFGITDGVYSFNGRTGATGPQPHDYASFYAAYSHNHSNADINWAGQVNMNGAQLYNYSAAVNAMTGTSYVLTPIDNGKVLTLNNAAAITLTVPSGLPAGFTCTIIQKGAGRVTISASGVTIINRQAQFKTAGQYAAVALISDVPNNFFLTGDTGN